MSFEPGCHFGMFVSSIIVHDEVQVETGRSFSIYFFEEADELLMPMAWQTVADNCTVEHAEGYKSCRFAIALAIACHGATAALFQMF